jgi:hypothetical protein
MNQDSLPAPRMPRRGLFAVEILAGIAVIMVVAGMLVTMSFVYLRSRNDLMLERGLRLAAQSQLERYRAGVRLNSPPPADLVPTGISLATTTAPGAGVWAGMTRITVTASGPGSRGLVHRITLSGYYSEVPPK